MTCAITNADRLHERHRARTLICTGRLSGGTQVSWPIWLTSPWRCTGSFCAPKAWNAAERANDSMFLIKSTTTSIEVSFGVWSGGIDGERRCRRLWPLKPSRRTSSEHHADGKNDGALCFAAGSSRLQGKVTWEVSVIARALLVSIAVQASPREGRDRRTSIACAIGKPTLTPTAPR